MNELSVSFPARYEDELLYSLLARYHLRSGNRSYNRTIKELFNVDSVVATVDFTSGLDILSKNINRLYTPEQLLFDNTLWTYYRPFLPIETVGKIENEIVFVNGQSVQLKAGVIPSGISFPKYLRYCPQCYRFDELKYGEPYWHRSHQLPGTFYCNFHKEQLIESNVLYKQHGSRQKFYPLSEIKLDGRYRGDIHNDKELKLFIAEQGVNLLNNKFTIVHKNFYRDFYINELFEKGFITQAKRVRFKEFIPSFKQTFDERSLYILESQISDSNDSWLHKVLRKPRVSCHPLRHILILWYLKTDVFAYQSNKELSCIGDPPFPCLNKAAQHFTKRVIWDYSITKSKGISEKTLTSGIFRCNCGFVYLRKGNNQLKRNRILKFGEVWEEKLLQLNRDGYNYYQIAKMLDVDYNTVKKRLEKLLTNKIISPTTNSNCLDIMKKLNREKWILNIRSNSNYSRTELRNEQPAVYSWLYRNDKEWLFVNSPPKKGRENCKKIARVNWALRDDGISQMILRESEKIKRKKNPLQRATKSRIGSNLGVLSLLHNSIDKLPKSRKTLMEVTESIEEFRIRRIYNVIQIIKQEGKNVREWELIRRAGLKGGLSEHIREIIFK